LTKGRYCVKIIVKAPLKAENIQQLLDGAEDEGFTFRFVEKKGFEMEFEVTGESFADPVDVVKALIKATDYGKGLYFSVVIKK